MIRPFCTITQPTMGLGSTLPRPPAARSRARRMNVSCEVASSVAIGIDLRLGRLRGRRLRFARRVQQAVDDHEADAGGKQYVGLMIGYRLLHSPRETQPAVNDH